jgi:hypothetical protein
MILGFNGQKWGGKKASIARFLYIGFWLCSHKYRKSILNIVTSYLIHSQIWLNLVKDDCHFSYIFLITYAMKNNNNSLIKGQCKLRIMFTTSKGWLLKVWLSANSCIILHQGTIQNLPSLYKRNVFFTSSYGWSPIMPHKKEQKFIKKRLMQTLNHVSPSCQRVDGCKFD